ncbi:MAG: ABC transporter permease [Bacteroidota bacterium]|nr:ABC transporter permease [Bacteroidota bacterium]
MKLLGLSFRALKKFKLYTAVNVLGLAISLACVIIIARYVYQETTVNSFAADLDRTFIMTVEYQNLAPAFKGSLDRNRDVNYRDPLDDASVERFSRFMLFEKDRISVNDNNFNVKSIVADSNFLKIMPFPVLLGSADFKQPNDVILTERLAKKMFGNENPVGKTITYLSNEPLTIIGVIGMPASKTSFDFDLLIHDKLKKHWAMVEQELVMLHSATDAPRLNRKNGEFMRLIAFGQQEVRYQLFPFKDFYFNRSYTLYQEDNPIMFQGNSDSIKVLLLVAFFILLVGVFNFINIYIVVTMRRAREFGVRKVFGAGLRHIFNQIFIENLLMALIALFFAWLFIEIIDVVLVERLDFAVQSNFSFDLLLSLFIALLLPIITSLYPFLRYAYFAPITSLRSVNVGGVSLVSRKLFLFLQYTITFGLLVVSLFFMKQLRYMLNADLGYNVENIIMCNMVPTRTSWDILSDEHFEQKRQRLIANAKLIEQKMNESPLFHAWTYGEPLYITLNPMQIKRSDKDDYMEVGIYYSALEDMKLLDFELKEGRLWDSTDVFTQYKCIINESAKKQYDIQDIHSVQLQPERRLWYSVGEDDDKNPTYDIVGVIKDFNTGHLSKATMPMMSIFVEKENPEGSLLMARFIPGKQEEAVAYLQELYKEINGDAEFTYMLMEDEIAALYAEDKRVSRVYTTFSLIAIFISCLGLFALSLFDIRQRYREIALRKVNGAKSRDIMRLLLKKYAYLLGASFAVSVPVTYWVINRYMEDFAHRTAISWWLFAISAVVVTAVSLLTLTWQVRRAMKINPASAMKAE